MLRLANVAVLVSGGGTNLQAIIDAANAGQIRSGVIRLVVSSKRGAYATERASKAGIPFATVARSEFQSDAAFETELLRLLRESCIDVIVLAGFMRILSAEFIENYSGRIINVHPSLIPSFCGKGYYGLRVHEAALEYGVKVTGATVHLVNETPDGGRILLQRAVDVLPGDTPETLQRRVMEQAEWVLLPRAVEMVCSAVALGKDII